jgi:hypothetical protein
MGESVGLLHQDQWSEKDFQGNCQKDVDPSH